jgi:hypothetical protein
MGRWFVFLLATVMATSAEAERLGAYDFPFVDPLVATVVRTPAANALPVPRLEIGDGLRRERLSGLVDRPVPEVFFYHRHGLEFVVAEQPGPAALVFAIAGTGGGALADSNRDLLELLHADGHHVIALANPTNPSFIVNASTTGVPGRLRSDAADLYRVMQAAYAQIADRIEVTGVHLAGFSLGATHAAFVAELDAREQRLGLERVLLLNPAVSVLASMEIVDEMLRVHEEADPGAVRRFIDEVLEAFGQLFQAGAPVDFAGDFIYRTYRVLELPATDMEKLIGLAFRLLGVNMMFTSDVIARSGFLVSPDTRLTTTSSLTEYYLRARQYGFVDYFSSIYGPFFAADEPGLTPEQMIAESDLATIEAYLEGAGDVGVITNEDDFILRPQDLDFLERVFKTRAAIYPTGGHGGNYRQRDVASRIQAFFRPETLVQ